LEIWIPGEGALWNLETLRLAGFSPKKVELFPIPG
jgi:hypothetical protein